jgi:hypothetical protein
LGFAGLSRVFRWAFPGSFSFVFIHFAGIGLFFIFSARLTRSTRPDRTIPIRAGEARAWAFGWNIQMSKTWHGKSLHRRFDGEQLKPLVVTKNCGDPPWRDSKTGAVRTLIPALY